MSASSKTDKLARLYVQKEKLEIRLKSAQDDSTRRFAALGWGTGMRYSKIPISYTKEDRLKAKLEAINNQIKEHENQNPQGHSL